MIGRTVYNFAGIRRSGIHAVMQWMMAGLDAPTAWWNNCNAERSHYMRRNATKAALSDNFDSAKGPDENIIFGFEDVPLVKLHNAPLSRHIPRNRTINVLLLRDPYNMTASRMERQKRRNAKAKHRYCPNRGLQLWRAYAMADGWVTMSFNRLRTEPGHRRQIADLLDMQRVPEWPQSISHYGKGSSFTGMKMDGRASDMPLDERWKAFADDPKFLKLTGGDDLDTLSRELCGFGRPW